MNFVLERVTQPAIEPVTLAQIIEHVREFSSLPQAAQDELTSLIVAGREWVEDYTGRALIDQTWRLSLSNSALPFRYTDTNTMTGIYTGTWFPLADGSILLRKAPVIAITSFVSVNSAGAETVIDPLTYELREKNSKWPRVFPLTGSWTTGEYRITFRAGFADRLGSPTQGAEMVPVRFLQAIKLWVEAHYDRDEKMMEKLLEAAENLIKPERAELQIA